MGRGDSTGSFSHGEACLTGKKDGKKTAKAQADQADSKADGEVEQLEKKIAEKREFEK